MPPEQRSDAREAFRIAVACHESMWLRQHIFWDEYTGELRERIRAGLMVAGIDPAELDGVVTKCMELVMRKKGEE